MGAVVVASRKKYPPLLDMSTVIPFSPLVDAFGGHVCRVAIARPLAVPYSSGSIGILDLSNAYLQNALAAA